jgi:hypothetical protein
MSNIQFLQIGEFILSLNSDALISDDEIAINRTTRLSGQKGLGEFTLIRPVTPSEISRIPMIRRLYLRLRMNHLSIHISEAECLSHLCTLDRQVFTREQRLMFNLAWFLEVEKMEFRNISKSHKRGMFFYSECDIIFTGDLNNFEPSLA